MGYLMLFISLWQSPGFCFGELSKTGMIDMSKRQKTWKGPQGTQVGWNLSLIDLPMLTDFQSQLGSCLRSNWSEDGHVDPRAMKNENLSDIWYKICAEPLQALMNDWARFCWIHWRRSWEIFNPSATRNSPESAQGVCQPRLPAGRS